MVEFATEEIVMPLQINVPHVPVFREEWPGSNRLVATDLVVLQGARLEVSDPFIMTVVGRGCCYDKEVMRITVGREYFYLIVEET